MKISPILFFQDVQSIWFAKASIEREIQEKKTALSRKLELLAKELSLLVQEGWYAGLGDGSKETGGYVKIHTRTECREGNRFDTG